MKRLLGIFIAVQVILTGMILYALNDISVSIKQAAIRTAGGSVTMSWSDNLSGYTYAILIALGCVGLIFAFLKEKNSKS